ncbi:MAG: hypothetical protein ACLTSZ_13240 [Lachnospiraceae bacterium]
MGYPEKREMMNGFHCCRVCRDAMCIENILQMGRSESGFDLARRVVYAWLDALTNSSSPGIGSARLRRQPQVS